MRLSKFEIRKRLGVHADPCAIFELVNRVAPPANFQFELSESATRQIRITTEPRNRLDLDPADLLDARIPELFDSGKWTVRLGAKSHVVGAAHAAIEPPTDDATPVTWQIFDNPSGDYSIEVEEFFKSYAPPGIPAPLSQSDTVRRKVYERTWFGGLKHLGTNATLRWENLGSCTEISTTDRKMVLEDQGMSEVIQLQSGSLVLRIAILTQPSDDIGQSFRIAGQGIASASDWLEPIRVALTSKPWNLDHWICEVDCRELVEGNLLVSSISDKQREDIEKLSQELKSHNVAIDASRKLYEQQLKRKVEALEARIGRARVAHTVFYGSRFLMNSPESEHDVMALFHILEGCDGLPFDEFRTRQWTPKVGIDALADFCLAPGQMAHTFQPVEFEYVFDNYIAHGHEPEHTRLIICWSVKDGRARHPKLFRHPLGLHWLWNYDAGGWMVPVAEIRSFPGVTVKVAK